MSAMMTNESTPDDSAGTPLVEFVYAKLASISEPIEAAEDFCTAIVGFLAIDVSEDNETLGGVIHRIGREIQDRIAVIGNVQSEIMRAIKPRPGLPDNSEVDEAAGASKIAHLIDAHKTARAVLHDACDEDEANRDEASPAWAGALDAEESALMAICSHRCRSLDEVSIRAQYLATIPDAKHQLDEFKFIDAIVTAGIGRRRDGGGVMKEREIETLDQAPAGWHALDVWREKSRSWDWIALMIDVEPDELKHCRCKLAWLYVHPNEYRPGSRVAREAWVRVPGKHRNKDAAWDAVCDMLEPRH